MITTGTPTTDGATLGGGILLIIGMRDGTLRTGDGTDTSTPSTTRTTPFGILTTEGIIIIIPRVRSTAAPSPVVAIIAPAPSVAIVRQ